VSGSSAGGVFAGDVKGVNSKGVVGFVTSTASKFERLDGGLVLGSDGPVILDGIGEGPLLGFDVFGSPFVNRPLLSLLSP
jgi:hypothetical protein